MKKSFGAKTLVFPTPVFIVGTYDKTGKANIATVAWGGICCSDPPCLGISLREATQTFHNIVEHKAFTVNIPSEKYIKQADYCGIESGKRVDKFSVTGLTAVRSELVDAPYIKEFPFIVECVLFQTIKLGLHTEFVGAIKDVKVDDEMVDNNGKINVEKIRPISWDPSTHGYFGIGMFLGMGFSVGKTLKT